MSEVSEEYYHRYSQIAKEKSTQPKEKAKITNWKLVFKVGKVIHEEIVSGVYSICQHYKNMSQYRNDKRFRIIPADKKQQY